MQTGFLVLMFKYYTLRTTRRLSETEMMNGALDRVSEKHSAKHE